MFKLSKYSVFYKIDDLHGMLFNTFNGRLVVLNNNILPKISDLVTYEQLTKYFQEDTSFLLENFFIENDAEDEKIIDTLLNNKYKSDKLIVTIMTTLACNLSCVYCYQQGIVDRHLNLEKNTANKIKDWFIEKINTIKPKEIICHFYGGEPMLNLDVLEDIIPAVINASENIGAQFTSYITTNGTLLNKSNILRLKKWKLDNAQISLDGPKVIHDQRRPLLNGEGTFDKIIENIGVSLSEGIHTVLRVNIDKHNFNYLDELFLELKKNEYHKNKNLQINLEIVSPILHPSSHCKKYTYSTEEEMKTLCGLWEKQVKYGFPIKSAMPIDSACENMMENSYTISSNGDIYMCPGFIGIENLKIGNIASGIDDIKYKQLLEINHWNKCIGCEYLPVCQGGCKMCAYVSTNKFNSIYCRKEFLNTIYPEFLKYKFLYENNRNR